MQVRIWRKRESLPSKFLGKSIPGRKNSKRKGPEADVFPDML